MRFLIDALGAPARSGGMRLYADGVIRGWLEAHPEDELVLLGGTWLREEYGERAGVRVVVWPNDNAIARILGQFLVAAVIYRTTRSDRVISLSPVVTSLVRPSRRMSTVQDWRHIKNPHEFGRAQLLYRRLWRSSVARAGAVVTMSAKTQAETEELVPTANSSVVETGRDYVRYWEPSPRASATGTQTIVTFGHHSNKRPELVIDAIALLSPERKARVSLVVLGARGAFQDALRARARELGVESHCVFPGFVEEPDYRKLVQGASLIVLASSDEGFGLPVAEANYLGIPALVASDSGLDKIHSQGIIVADPDPASMALAMEAALAGDVPVADTSSLTRWRDTASGIRLLSVGAPTR